MNYFFYVHTTIRQKYMVFFHLIFLLCTTIPLKIRVLINLFFLFVHNHSTKVIEVTLTLQFILLFIVPMFRLLYSGIVTKKYSLEIRAVKLRFLLIYKIMLKSIAMASGECTAKQENKTSYNTYYIVPDLIDFFSDD